MLDAYRPNGIPNEVLIRKMLPQIVSRAFKLGVMKGQHQQAEGGPELALFEKIFMAHFEGGIPIGEELEKGRFNFLAKSEKGWVEFFQKFVAFTMERKGNLNNVQALVVRGILKPMLVSDLKFTDGKTDKFVRLLIQNPQVMAKIASMAPGEVISHDLLMQWAEAFGGLEFAYQALSHRVVNPEAVKDSQSPVAEAYQTPEQMKGAAIREGVRDDTQGIALSARTEQAVAERLNFNLGLIRRDVGLFLKKKKGEFSGGEPVFVPWYQHITRPQRFKGKVRWWVPLLYFAGVSAAIFGLIYVFR